MEIHTSFDPGLNQDELVKVIFSWKMTKYFTPKSV